MDLKRLLNNRNIVDSASEPGMSYNSRQFGPYKVGTQIQDMPGFSGSKLVHSIELPEDQEQSIEMANRVAKELKIDPENIYKLNPGESWMSGNTDITTPEIDEERFKRINNMFKK